MINVWVTAWIISVPLIFDALTRGDSNIRTAAVMALAPAVESGTVMLSRTLKMGNTQCAGNSTSIERISTREIR